MVIMLAVARGLSYCVSTLWGLQEERFAAVFEMVTSAAMSLAVGLMLCFLNRDRDRDEPQVVVDFL